MDGLSGDSVIGKHRSIPWRAAEVSEPQPAPRLHRSGESRGAFGAAFGPIVMSPRRQRLAARRAARALTLWIVCVASALAQQSPSTDARIEVTTAAERLAAPSDSGGAELVPAPAPTTGDEIIYTVTFTNTGGPTADGVRVTNPIPKETRYLAGTAYGPGCEVLFSVDGGRTFGSPSELKVLRGDGTRAVADAAEYTHIRWILRAPLGAGAKGFARFRAVVR
jgi:uncharacterized repeat protein (TIGR01451 family)